MKAIEGTATLRGVTVSVHPGGALSSLTLSPKALAQAPAELAAAVLAAAVLAAVATATDAADKRTRRALAAVGADLSVLAPVEEPETTVPESWRVP